MAGWAGELDADQLARPAGKVLTAVAPATAAETMEARLQREVEAAQRQRSLPSFVDGASVRFGGSLPRVAAEAWIAQLDAVGEQHRRTILERRDRLIETLTPEQRQAAALITLIQVDGKGPNWPARPSSSGSGRADPAPQRCGETRASSPQPWLELTSSQGRRRWNATPR